MENASKALIIAGAILLSILIIALGVYIFNMAKSSVNTDTLDSLDISTFNSQFTQYEGDQLGSSVKSLLTAIIASNNTNSDAEDRLIEVTYDNTEGPSTMSSYATTYTITVDTVGDVSTSLGKLSSALSNTHHYYIEFEYDSSGTGYVKYCTINYTQP